MAASNLRPLYYLPTILMEKILTPDMFEEWAREVRDPATYRSEGARQIAIGGRSGCSLEYHVAPLDSGYALKYQLGYSGGGFSVPWIAYASRSAAIDHLVESCTAYSRRMLDSRNAVTRSAFASLLGILEPGTLFGFQEPEPAPKSRWYDRMLKDQVGRMTMEQNWRILDVIRGGDFRPTSQSGSFFDIPVPR